MFVEKVGNGESGSGKTGFQEEFERAIERREKTGEPEIWLFFKDIPDEERKDPGEQLKKVLAFQDGEEKAKRLLYQRFADSAEWRRLNSAAATPPVAALTKEEGDRGNATGCASAARNRHRLPQVVLALSPALVRVSRRSPQFSERVANNCPRIR